MPRISPSIRLAAGAAAVAVVAAPLMAGTPATAATKQEKQRGKRANVYVQGDSLTVGAASPLHRKLDRKVKRVGIDAQVGRFTSTGMARLKGDRRAKNSKVWVLALGTNDGPDPRALKKHIKRSLRMAGPDREVIWLTLRRPGGYERVNTMLRSLDGTSDRLHVVDWAKATARNPGLLAGDRVHATSHGYQVRANMIADAAVDLARQP